MTDPSVPGPTMADLQPAVTHEEAMLVVDMAAFLKLAEAGIDQLLGHE